MKKTNEFNDAILKQYMLLTFRVPLSFCLSLLFFLSFSPPLPLTLCLLRPFHAAISLLGFLRFLGYVGWHRAGA